MKPNGLVIQKDLNGATDTEIIGIEYDLEILKIFINSSGGNATVEIIEPLGFRVLDEGDLGEFWPVFSSPSGWIFEVKSGGWKDLESTRGGFLSSHHAALKEYLVTGEDDCISVIGFNKPQVKYDPMKTDLK